MAVFNLYGKNEALGFDHVHRRGDSSSKAIQEHPRQMVKRVYEEFTNNIFRLHERKSRNSLRPKGSRSTPSDAQVRGIENLVQAQ